MYYDTGSYVANHINLSITKNIFRSSVLLSKKSLRIMKLLYNIGFIKHYYIFNKLNGSRLIGYIKFSCFYFNKKPFYKSLKIVSTPSKRFTISYKSLRLFNRSSRSSILILSTDRGLITDKEAISLGLGGLIVFAVN
jgi:ribosomal protein S8